MNTVPLKIMIDALEALRSAEVFFDKQDGQSALWAKTMKARVTVEYYVNQALQGKVVEMEAA